jgi:mannose-6-phosphate isomerase
MAELGDASTGRVEKPWGYELRWAITDRYIGKVLRIEEGESLSLQYHRRKDETILVCSGLLELEVDGASYRLGPGATARIRPGVRHRMTALEECEVFEVSTPEMDDVVRLEDRYGRV